MKKAKGKKRHGAQSVSVLYNAKMGVFGVLSVSGAMAWQYPEDAERSDSSLPDSGYELRTATLTLDKPTRKGRP